MKTLFRHVFASERAMVINLVLAGLANLVYFIVLLLRGLGSSIPMVLLQIILFALLLVTVRAYFRHDKNVMKCTMGATLILVVVRWLFTMSTIQIFSASFISFAFSGAIFITHLLVNSSHHSSPRAVFANQLISIIYMVVCLEECIRVILRYGTGRLDLAATYLALIFTLNVILNVESKLDAFRIAREQE